MGKLLCLTFFRDRNTWAGAAWAGERFLEINFWSCAAWGCWLRDNRCLRLETAFSKTVSGTSCHCKPSTQAPCIQNSLMNLSSLALVKQIIMQTGSEICIHTLLYLVHFLITHLHKNVGISAEFLLFFFIAQFRQLQGNQKGIERKSKKLTLLQMLI